ncbi:MAG: hypothetical protein AAF614_11630 [Chloroflexota bacterium]
MRNLLQLLPPDTSKIVEALCGSAVFSLNAPWLPRVVNDKNDDVIHLLRVIYERPLELQHALDLTAYHRSEFTQATTPIPADCDEIERARRIFVRFGMARGGGGQEVKPHDWGRSISSVTQRGMMSSVGKFRSRIARLDRVAARLNGVQFESGDFAKLSCYDGEKVFWFFDPPWEPETRVEGAQERYELEFLPEDYGRLLRFARSRLGRVLVIGYDGGLLAAGLADWRRVNFEITLSAGQGRGKRRVVGWLNWG